MPPPSVLLGPLKNKKSERFVLQPNFHNTIFFLLIKLDLHPKDETRSFKTRQVIVIFVRQGEAKLAKFFSRGLYRWSIALYILALLNGKVGISTQLIVH